MRYRYRFILLMVTIVVWLIFQVIFIPNLFLILAWIVFGIMVFYQEYINKPFPRYINIIMVILMFVLLALSILFPIAF